MHIVNAIIAKINILTSYFGRDRLVLITLTTLHKFQSVVTFFSEFVQLIMLRNSY